jgi:HAD superfamily hydrolase (TIGR01509 family)
VAKQRLFARHDTPFSRADHVAVYGTSDTYTASYFAQRMGLGPEQEADILKEYVAHMRELLSAGFPMRPGARELIAAVRGRVPLGLASNTRRSLVDLVLVSAGIDAAFDAIATGDEASPKPAPDVYLLACQRLGVDPRASVAIEDSPTGVRAARAAGMTAYAVPSEPGTPFPEADLVVPSLLDLL